MSPSSSKPQTSTPTTLRPAKDSWKLKKPTSPDRRLPLIVHVEPARIIYAKPQEFMGLVQRLTGKPSPAAGAAASASTPASCSVLIRSVPDINVAYEAEDEDSSSYQ
ncbi:hypothetical protein M5K25_002686 [Dendrobium thyrsiflorum]|uniref:VQ domain-containing protein n=1 Tax=Dendrobium thyrsiflorum TaxID=117978 RepID=A0ABD0VV90_DENTH